MMTTTLQNQMIHFDGLFNKISRNTVRNVVVKIKYFVYEVKNKKQVCIQACDTMTSEIYVFSFPLAMSLLDELLFQTDF